MVYISLQSPPQGVDQKSEGVTQSELQTQGEGALWHWERLGPPPIIYKGMPQLLLWSNMFVQTTHRGSFTRKQELILLVHGHLSITTMKTMPPTHMELELASYHYSCTCEFTHTIAMNFITPIVLSLYLGVVKQLCKRGHPKGIHPVTPTHPHTHTHSHHTQTHSHAVLWLCINRMHTHTGDSFTWNTNTYLDSPAYPKSIEEMITLQPLTRDSFTWNTNTHLVQ